MSEFLGVYGHFCVCVNFSDFTVTVHFRVTLFQPHRLQSYKELLDNDELLSFCVSSFALLQSLVFGTCLDEVF